MQIILYYSKHDLKNNDVQSFTPQTHCFMQEKPAEAHW